MTNRHRRRAAECLLAAAALASLGCQAGPGEVPASEAVLPIIGGNVAKTCVWPTAIMLIGPVGCSGALVHTRVVVTAGHCLAAEDGTFSPPTAIGLGETSTEWAKTVEVSRCYSHPDNDFGICVLNQDVMSIPIVPVMAPCEMSELAAGKAIVEVGFGWTTAAGRAYGTKKWINGTLDSFAPDQVDIDVTTGSQDGEYYGDSGGPLLFQMPDSTWRVIGVDYGSPAVIEGSTAPRVSTYTSVPYDVAWAEEVSGIDLTPCHDANGWHPTAACTGFPINPGQGLGTWSQLCQGEGMLSQRTCSAADAGTDGARRGDAGGESRDGPPDGPGDSSSGDGPVNLDGDSDTGWEDSGDDSADVRDSGGTGGRAGSADAPRPDSAGGSDTSAGAGAGSTGAGGESGGSTGAGGSESDGSAGADGSESDGSAGAGGNGADVGYSDSSGGAGASGGRDGGDEAAPSGGTAGSSGTSGWDGGADASAISAGDAPSGSVVDSGAHQTPPRSSGSGCACRSVSDRDARSWPGLLGLGLVATRLIRRRARVYPDRNSDRRH
jgi:Trypsin